MPIYQVDLGYGHEQNSVPTTEPINFNTPLSQRRFSEESLPVELCEGPIPDSPINPSTPEDDESRLHTSDRSVLIERIKRGQSPSWIPNRHYESMLHFENSAADTQTSPSHSPSTSSGLLLPAVQITPEKDSQEEALIDERAQEGLNIERPRSALHSGDFTQDSTHRTSTTIDDSAHRRSRHEDRLSSEASWLATSPPRHFTPSFHFDKQMLFTESSYRSSNSLLSSSVSSSFAYQPPTSPLAQSVSNDDLERATPLSSERFSFYRRHTMGFEPPSPLASAPGMPASLRREAYQAHQPRRSLNSAVSFTQHGILPTTPSLPRSRRLSIGSDSSPMQHASMVGSYEESILRGRMSSTPSKPFEFTAQIGVLGKGECKPSLKCPPHVTLAFPAVFYNYSETSLARTSSNDGPSPYVGSIDLENGLPNSGEGARLKKKIQSRYSDKPPVPDADYDMILNSPDLHLHDLPARSRSKRRSASPRAPPGGSYRIPEQGQIQIVVKNQNKTAVKLFLVPYDLTGMTPGTKTFIRQRSYSNGPIIDDVPRVSESDPLNRPMLRYLVHLHICCPSKGRYYLYKSIRIVFANRVPDGKEKLRNETTWPEPRFTPYKPIRVMHPISTGHTGQTGHTTTMLASDMAFRRRSLGLPINECSRASYAPLDTMPPRTFSSGRGNTMLIDAIPFQFPRRHHQNMVFHEPCSNLASVLRSPGSDQSTRPSTEDSADHPTWSAAQYEKLNKGDAGYGGNAFSMAESSPVGGSPILGGAEGLLSQRLRSLGVKQGANKSNENEHILLD